MRGLVAHDVRCMWLIAGGACCAGCSEVVQVSVECVWCLEEQQCGEVSESAVHIRSGQRCRYATSAYSCGACCVFQVSDRWRCVLCRLE